MAKKKILKMCFERMVRSRLTGEILEKKAWT